MFLRGRVVSPTLNHQPENQTTLTFQVVVVPIAVHLAMYWTIGTSHSQRQKNLKYGNV